MTRINKIALFLAVAALPGTVLATPTITFDGEVTDQTCSVSINGQNGNVTVMLPTVRMNEFTTPFQNGATAGDTAFTVSVSGCTAPSNESGTNIGLKLYGYDVTSGTLGNRATGSNVAKGFGIQIMTSSGGTGVHLDGITKIPGLVLKKGETAASYEYGVRYYVVDVDHVEPGKISAVAEYTLTYF